METVQLPGVICYSLNIVFLAPGFSLTASGSILASLWPEVDEVSETEFQMTVPGSITDHNGRKWVLSSASNKDVAGVCVVGAGPRLIVFGSTFATKLRDSMNALMIS